MDSAQKTRILTGILTCIGTRALRVHGTTCDLETRGLFQLSAQVNRSLESYKHINNLEVLLYSTELECQRSLLLVTNQVCVSDLEHL